MAREVVRSWTVEEFFGGDAQPTEDDVPIALYGQVLDTPAKGDRLHRGDQRCPSGGWT